MYCKSRSVYRFRPLSFRTDGSELNLIGRQMVPFPVFAVAGFDMLRSARLRRLSPQLFFRTPLESPKGTPSHEYGVLDLVP